MSAVEEEVVKKEASAFLEETPEFRDAVARCENAEDDLAMVQAGTYLWKVRSYSKWYRRKFILDMEEGTLRYLPTHNPGCRGGDQKFIDLADIVDVRRGWKTDTFNKFGIKVIHEQKKKKLKKLRKMSEDDDSSQMSTPSSRAAPTSDKPVVDEAACFSVVFGRSRATLDLVAASPQLASLWVRALRNLLVMMRSLRQEERFNRWISEQFFQADRDHSGTLIFEECLVLLKQLNVKMSRSKAFEMFNKANTDGHERDGLPSLDAKEFAAFYQMLMRRTEVEVIYHQYAHSAGEMTAKELQKFLRKEQRMEDVTEEECRAYIDAHENHEEDKKNGRISLMGFTSLLLAEQFQVMNPEHKLVFQDMNQPLSSYYIACSHNTYLLGRQVVAESTIEGYVEALRRGCRCLELDCWDGNEGEPVVTHGYALTSKILFRDVLVDAILPNAFLVSEYPIILSLENHCTAEQQKRLAFHIADVFGDLLYSDPVDPTMENLPSPEQLKRKIIIKGRKVAQRSIDESSESDSEDEEEDSKQSNTEKPKQNTPSKALTNGKDNDGHVPNNVRTKVLKVTDQNLSDLVNICQGAHFHGFEKEGKCYEIVSLAESKALRLSEKKGKELVKFNTKRLSKVYPAGTRAASSNFKPLPFWNSGCQLLALNYQGTGKPIIFNEAKFSVNGSCGYILKPDFLRLPDVHKFDYDPAVFSIEQLPFLMDRKKHLEIKILSAQHLPKAEGDGLSEIVDPYVKVKIIGHPIDKCKRQTSVIHDNGFNPVWNATFRFTVHLPELAFLYLVIKDETPRRQDPILACSAVPFCSLAQGYRHVPLFDEKRRPLEPASLFVNIKITDVT